jgi:hypothetical protein
VTGREADVPASVEAAGEIVPLPLATTVAVDERPGARPDP